MPEDIIFDLKKQHQEMKGILAGIKDKLHTEAPESSDILKRLLNFKKSLDKHLRLENNTFYPELLKKMKERNLEVSNTELFIGEMKTLEMEIIDFLKKYDDPKKIDNNLARFKPEFDFIISSLMIRITSEEDGVFLYW
jgi:hemerythrin-like domain-containing protein